jgi:hypothetical protein
LAAYDRIIVDADPKYKKMLQEIVTTRKYGKTMREVVCKLIEKTHKEIFK